MSAHVHMATAENRLEAANRLLGEVAGMLDAAGDEITRASAEPIIESERDAIYLLLEDVAMVGELVLSTGHFIRRMGKQAGSLS